MIGWFTIRRKKYDELEAVQSAIALMSDVDIDVVQQAARRLHDEPPWWVRRRSFVLTGTTALQIRGCKFETHDVDFLCEYCPGGDDKGKGSGGSTRTEIDGVMVDFIYADPPRLPFLTRDPDIICGVPVASIKDVLAFKAFANRPKDIEFLKQWALRYGMERAA